MTPQIKIILLLFLVLFIHSSPSCRVEGYKDGMKVITPPICEAIIKLMKTRKLMTVNYTVMDYDYGGANPRHDPRKGKFGSGGGGGKNNP